MKKLNLLLEELGQNIARLEKSNPNVSSATVGWQIDHSLKVINSICSQVKKSDPSQFKKEFSFNRLLVFTTNHIPRGKGKAPKVVQPEGISTQTELNESLERAKNNLEQLKLLQGNFYFRHPYFRDLNVKQTQKFLLLHTLHHLKIVRDIVK